MNNFIQYNRPPFHAPCFNTFNWKQIIQWECQLNVKMGCWDWRWELRLWCPISHVRDLDPSPQIPPQAWMFCWNLSQNSLSRNGTQVNNSIYWNVSKLREYGEGMGSTFKLVKLSFAGLSLILNPSNLIPKCWIFFLLDSWTLHKMRQNFFCYFILKY